MGSSDEEPRQKHLFRNGVPSGSVSLEEVRGDITADQFRGIAAIQREFDADIRLTNRQNLIIRGLDESELPVLYERLEARVVPYGHLERRLCRVHGGWIRG